MVAVLMDKRSGELINYVTTNHSMTTDEVVDMCGDRKIKTCPDDPDVYIKGRYYWSEDLEVEMKKSIWE